MSERMRTDVIAVTETVFPGASKRRTGGLVRPAARREFI